MIILTRKSKLLLWGLISATILSILGYIAYQIYLIGYTPVGRNDKTVYLLVGEQNKLPQLRKQIHDKIWPKYPQKLDKLIQLLKLEDKLQSGRYAIAPETTTWEMLQILIDHQQTPIRLDLRGIRTESDLCETIGKYLMMKPEAFRQELFKPERLQKYALDSQSVRSLFFAQEYELLWDIKPKALMDSIERVYTDFWTPQRQKQLDSLQINRSEASALAAIIESESNKRDEYPNIARLYLNRYHKGMMLQSDPTVKFALGDFGLRRILNEHLRVDSPYNTYRNTGLTPGPIRIPQQGSIDSILSAPAHKYLYMCAKEDFSGYHNFAEHYSTHLTNARLYQKALNERGIK